MARRGGAVLSVTLLFGARMSVGQRQDRVPGGADPPRGLTRSTASAGDPTCAALTVPKPEWTSDDDGIRRLSYDVDVDGDGRPDRLEAEESYGSGGGMTSVSLRLTGSGERVDVVHEANFYSMVDFTEIPPELEEAGNRCALQVIERELFGEVADRADPSLEWLLTPEERRVIRWVAGPPVLPKGYTIRRAADWVSYRGRQHSGPMDIEAALHGKPGQLAPVVLARRGQRVLLGTRHGVILTDPGRTRHAWIYVSLTGGNNKVRLPSVRSAEITGNLGTIHLEEGAREAGPAVVRVDLRTGRLAP